jgi:hypothetical protein
MKRTYLLFPILLILLCSSIIDAQTLNPSSNISIAGSADGFKGGYTFSYATAGSPWNGSLISYGGFSNDYDCQISSDYGPHGGKHISFRTKNGDVGTWNPWCEIWHSDNFNPSTFIPQSIVSSDTRATNYLPQDRNSGVYFDFKSNSTDGLADANFYHGVMTFRPYGGSTDFTGGLAHQLAFTDNGNMWLRSGANNAWLSWTKIYSDKNINRSDIDFNAKNIYANGNIWAKEIKVALVNPWPDYILNDDYRLPSLKEVEKYIKENNHLQNVPTAEEVKEKGLELGEAVKIQQEKIEELTLYLIQQNKEIEALKKENESFKKLSERLSLIEKELEPKISFCY